MTLMNGLGAKQNIQLVTLKFLLRAISAQKQISLRQVSVLTNMLLHSFARTPTSAFGRFEWLAYQHHLLRQLQIRNTLDPVPFQKSIDGFKVLNHTFILELENFLRQAL